MILIESTLRVPLNLEFEYLATKPTPKFASFISLGVQDAPHKSLEVPYVFTVTLVGIVRLFPLFVASTTPARNRLT